MIAITDRAKKIHFIGIGGSGMSGLAKLALQAGHRVSGSDLKNSEVTAGLAALGAEIYLGHAADHLSPDVGQVVYSSAVADDNPELVEAKRRRLEVTSRGEYLARLMNRYEGIAVAGAHGKTTTTAMIATVLKKAGLDPTVAVGGTLVQEGTNAWLGRGRYMVAEADESDGSFLLLRPKVAVVTNVENDHLDHYGSLELLKDAFRRFVAQTDPQGLVVLNADDPFLTGLATQVANSTTYGWRDGAAYRAELVELDGRGSKSKVYERGEFLGMLELAVPGRHNVANALAAVAVSRWLGLPFKTITGALAGYAGVARRFQLIGEAAGRLVIDDYAHHPTEVKATLAAARQLGRRVLVVFQPHRYTRTARLYHEFGPAFADANLAVITDVYGAGEKPLPGVGGHLIAEEVRRYGHPPVYYRPKPQELLEFVAGLSQPGDLVLTMGAGDIWQLGRRLLQYWHSS